jgi:hypothetical protein
LIESPGVAFIVGKDTYNFKDDMFQGILGCWPVLAIPIVMTYIAGFFIWLLVGVSINKNSKHSSFRLGMEVCKENGFG